MCFDKWWIKTSGDCKTMVIVFNIVKPSNEPPVQSNRSQSNTREPRRNNTIKADLGQKSCIFGQKSPEFQVQSGLFTFIPDFLWEFRTLNPALREFRRYIPRSPEWGLGFRNSGLFSGLSASLFVLILFLRRHARFCRFSSQFWITVPFDSHEKLTPNQI